MDLNPQAGDEWLSPADLLQLMTGVATEESENEHWDSFSENPTLDRASDSFPGHLNTIIGVEDRESCLIASDEVGFLGTQIQPSDILDILEHVCSSETNGIINNQSLNLLITRFSQNELSSEDSDTNLPTTLFVLSQLLLKRANISGSVVDADRAIEFLTKAARVSQGEATVLVPVLQALAKAHQRRFMRHGGTEDINMAIEYQNQAIASTGDRHENYGLFKGELGSLLWLRYGALGDLIDLNEAIECQIWAHDFNTDADDHKANTLNNLGNSYMSRFECLGDLDDIAKAIDCQTQAVLLTPEGHPNRPSRLSNLGNSYLCQFERLGELECIERAIDCQSKAVQLTLDGHPDKPSQLSNLGSSYVCRFERLDELDDISKAIEYHIQAVELTAEGHPETPSRFSNLSVAYISRYERLGEVDDIDRAINFQSHAVELTPQEHPKRLSRVNNLGISYKSRFERLGVLEDINKAIGYLDQVVQLIPKRHPSASSLFNNLGLSRKARFERLGTLDDIIIAIDCQTQAVELTPKGHPNTYGQLGNLGNSYMSLFQKLGNLDDISQAIDYQVQAVLLIPEGHPNRPRQLSNLGNSYLCQFERLGGLADIREAIDYQAQAVEFTPEGHPDKPSHISNLGISYLCRFERLGELEDISKSIECQTHAVRLTPQTHSDMPNRFNNLGNSYLYRFQRSYVLDDVDQAINLFQQAVSLTHHHDSNLPALLNSLGIAYSHRFKNGESMDDLNKGVEWSLQAIHKTLDGHVEKPSRLHNLGNQYMMRFQHLGEPKDLGSAIENYTRALRLLPPNHVQTSMIQYVLGSTCLRHFKKPQDRVTALGYLEAAARSATGIPSVRFEASRDWAKQLITYNRSASLPAHRTAMQLLPEVIWLGTTFSRRYERIIEVGTVTVEAAAAAISAQKYGLALEWLAEGRYIIWNQILQLRTPCDILASVQSVLAQKLQKVSRDLECASRRKSAVVSIVLNPATLEQATSDHHRLVGEYNTLISEVRTLPGFEDFMRPKRAAELITGARLGPVVVVNIDAHRCDALILVPSSGDIKTVSLPDLSQALVNELHDLLRSSLRSDGVRERKLRRATETSDKHFLRILSVLWHKLVKPILNSLELTRRLPIDQLPHITWCSTGALTFLPIHAAGDYALEEWIFDFAITSYTPTLSALIPSEPWPSDKVPGVIAVAQAMAPGFSPLPGTLIELEYIKKHVKDVPCIQLKGTHATPQAVLDAMEKYECVHLACHASQDIDTPLKSGFVLHGGMLSLEAIAQRSLGNKSLAFLSACETAAGDLKLPDEAFHLAAGMLVAGYPRVIATMWSVVDCDAPLVADYFYRELMTSGVLDCSQVGRALHAAVDVLRNKVGIQSFTRWVPYIHIGQ